MPKQILSCTEATLLNRKSCQSTFRFRRLMSIFTSLSVLMAVSLSAFAEPAFVVLAADKGAPGISSLPQQLSNWRHSGLLNQVRLLRSDESSESNFELLGTLEFSDEPAMKRWQEAASAELGEGVNIIASDVLAHLETGPRDSSGSVFVVMQYDVMVPRPEFQNYIDGYQLPEMVVRLEAGGLLAYTSYYKHSGYDAPWQSLLVVEYRDEHAYEVSADVNSALGKELAKTDKTFSMYRETKLNIRDKTLTTKTSWLELPPPDSAQ